MKKPYIIAEIGINFQGKTNLIIKLIFAAKRAGANAVNIYTAFIYQGPGVAARINSGLLKKMDDEGVGFVGAIRRCLPVPRETS